MTVPRLTRALAVLLVPALASLMLAAMPPSAHAAVSIALNLPVAEGATIRANGPHVYSSGVRSSVDFGAESVGGTLAVYAAAPGVVHAIENGSGFSRCRVYLDHADGWRTQYQHLINVPSSLAVGQQVAAGQLLGYAGIPQVDTCGGGSGRHLHFGLWRYGAEVAIDGTSIGGYTVHATGSNYDGYWTDDDTGQTVVTSAGSMQCCLTNDTQVVTSAARESGTSVIADGSGRVWSFAITQAGTLKYRYTGGSGWQPFQTVGGGYQSVAATLDGSGRVLLAVTTNDGVLKFRRTNNAPTAGDTGSGWEPWSAPQGAGNWVNLSASTDGLGRVWLYATKTNGDLYYKRQDNSQAWSLGFVEVGNGNWRSVASAYESDNQRSWMFATKTNGDLYYRYTDPTDPDGWGPMTLAGSGWAGDVSAFGDTAGRIWMFAVKANGDLLYRRTDSSSSGWTAYSTVGNGGWASVASGIQPDATADGDPWMLATKTNGDLYYRHTDSGGWMSFHEVGNGGWK